MTSSPTFSSASSSTAENFSRLPIMAMKSKIIDKIMENRVTLIVGETGCGKSSQVPQFLLEANMEPILCTQPRRFAVVAVARMLARARNCEVGGEIGYHIGHSRVFSARSKIIFKTAGVLLDEMLEKGLKALKYKVIVLDEVHERSVESDLVLVCVKQFLLKNSDLRLVLMSATADISRYREYFRDLGRGERVEVLAVPPESGKATIFQHKVSYLEQIMELLGMKSENPSLEYCSGSSPMMAMADFKPEVHKLIHNLVLQIHTNEADIEKSILVFLPTYYALEQQWFILKPFSDLFKVHILHRSVDTEQALKAMRIWKSHRKIILATNIAESSVTIPKVGYVIDSCRSLQVFWDNNRKTDSAELVWVSKSQADQRKGRTGRTCDGHVYRLVTGSFYGQLDDFESPAILKLSLRQQVLLICCAESKAINDPKALLQKAMDPPDGDVIDDALYLLVHMHALEKASRGRHEPSFYGRLLASFSLSFDASVLILKFGAKGMLREGILFGILMDLQPLPILHPFGREYRVLEYTYNYYNGDNKNIGLGKKEALCMANFCAYEFWQRVFKDKCRLDRVKNIWKIDEVEDKTILISKMEEEWCSFHNLVVPALQQVTETYEEILNSLHRFRPMVLVISKNLPPYYEPYEFRHTCQLKCEQRDDTDALDIDDEPVDLDGESRRCTDVPFVGSKDFQTDIVARTFASIVKEMRIQLTQDVSSEQKISSYGNGRHVDRGVSMCRFFASGFCNRGSHCLFSHSLQAKKPVCKFFFSLQGCRNGGSCYFSHDSDSLAISDHESSSYCQEDEGSDVESLMRYFPAASEGCILVLDDIDLHFSSYISLYIDASRIICTTSQTNPSILHPSLKVTNILCGLSHPYETILFKAGRSEVPWNEVKCVLWFPRIDSEHGDEQKHLMQNFFIYMAIRLLADALHDVQVILTMNNIRFSQIQVEPMARDSFFFLKESFPFDESSFGELFDEKNLHWLGSVMSRGRAIESCTFHLQSWRPFQLDCDSPKTGPHSKRPCRSDRATSFSIDALLDMSKLSLFDDDKPLAAAHKRWFARKRRRRGGSRSVSGRSSDRRCCSVGASAANGTCSDFPMAAGTDSSGELFVNGGGEVNWASDVSEVARNSRREREGNVVGERDGQFGNFDGLGNESGYGSEPGYRGDVELGYGDEVEEEEDDPRLLFWGKEFGDNASNLERVGENSLQKTHHRVRRKKHDLRMVDALR